MGRSFSFLLALRTTCAKVFKSCSEMKLNSVLAMLLLHLHYNNWRARGKTPECPKMSGRFSLSGLCCQNILPSAWKALHCEAGACGTVARSSAWGRGGFRAGLAPCRDRVGDGFRVQRAS